MTKTLPHHATCRHEAYRLTCAEFETLLAEFQYSCGTCGSTGLDTTLGMLVIDHDGTVGDWAVRGMLCTPCNVAIRIDREDPDWAVKYLANPWWKRMLAERGLDLLPPEPTDYSINRDSGSVSSPAVIDFDGRIWHRSDDVWDCGTGKTAKPLSWAQLVRAQGPHTLRPWRREGYEAISADALEVLQLSWKQPTTREITLRLDDGALAAKELRKHIFPHARVSLAWHLLNN